MAEGRDAADGEAGDLADESGIGAHQRLAEHRGHALLVDPVVARDQEKDRPAAVLPLEDQGLDDLAHRAAAGGGSVGRSAGAVRHDPHLDREAKGLGGGLDAGGGGGKRGHRG